MPSNDYVAEETLYLDKEGRVTKDKAAAVTKLVHAGGKLSAADATKYGVTGVGDEAADSDAADDAAVAAPKATKKASRKK